MSLKKKSEVRRGRDVAGWLMMSELWGDESPKGEHVTAGRFRVSVKGILHELAPFLQENSNPP